MINADQKYIYFIESHYFFIKYIFITSTQFFFCAAATPIQHNCKQFHGLLPAAKFSCQIEFFALSGSQEEE